jgi:predicted nuclease of predicted toxin-antitoxin system
LKFKIDENLPAEYSAELRATGQDAETVGAEGLSGPEDGSLFEHCKREDRILVTLDLDF